MVMSLRVSELQVLLGYAGRNKHGRKHELLTMALHLLKAGCSTAVQMKIKELYCRRFPTKMVSPSELALPGPHYPASGGVAGGGGTAALPAGLSQLAYEGHGHGGVPSPAALLPISLLGPGKHELSGLTHHLPTSATLHPVHPDVKLQRLPFYDMLDELIKPTSLASDNSQRFQETCFAFALTPQQVQQISSSMDISGTKCDFTVQVQLRFCLSETSCPQEDHFPPNLCVKVNGKPCNLPGYLPPTKNGVEPKRPSRPINITSVVRLSTTVPNTIVVSWTSEVGRSYSMAVYLVKQQSSTILLQRLRSKGIRNPDHSRALIKEKLTADPDSEIATTSLRVSLLCPLGKMRLMIPCRALTCSHLQCFDATLYIQMNEKKPTWVCPVCDKKAPYEHLIIDGLFMEILNSCVDCDEIQFKEDGYWAPMRTKKEVQEVSSASYNNGVEGLHRSAAGEQRSSSSHNGGSSRMKVEVIDLTLDSSSEDDDDDQPPLKRPCASLSPTSPPIVNKGVLNLHHQVSPVSRTPRMPSVDTSYIPPVPPLIQDYRPYYHTPNDLTDLNFFSFLQGDNHQHYNMVMAAAAAASASDDHELLLNHFRPYTTSSSSSQLFLDQSGAPSSGSLAPVNGGGGGGNSSGGSSSSLVSSSSLRDTHSTHSTHSQPHSTPSQPHSTPSQPHSTHSQPHSTPSQPHSTPSQPHSTHSQPHSTHSQPHSTHSQPHSTPSQPHSTPSQPHSTPSQPHSTPSQPHPGVGGRSSSEVVAAAALYGSVPDVISLD
ncbi:E3 SUMO-protein ligase PIAS1 isoform X2 [Coregonus clupeaformis]|uniref:E3 SUMO-protein ligase PIAS1 isoform X2 n=1 Tax=Coregonus clupeaformis TaxID=59861 RepID=UPI001E1C681D|nr:E3 SUMO-protein ligase PIAS1 isoform X2 [Coregonus clupeaformis]